MKKINLKSILKKTFKKKKQKPKKKKTVKKFNKKVKLKPLKKKGRPKLIKKDIKANTKEKNKEKELWTGILMGPEAAVQKLAIDDAYPISHIDDILPSMIEGRDRIYYSMGKDDKFDDQVMDWVKIIRQKAKMEVPHFEKVFLMNVWGYELQGSSQQTISTAGPTR